MMDMKTACAVARAHLRAAYLALWPHAQKRTWEGDFDRIALAYQEVGGDTDALTEPSPIMRVWWTIDLPAADPAQAAREACAIQRDPQSTALVYDVEGTGGLARVDLEDA
jgi:hypothetical protein